MLVPFKFGNLFTSFCIPYDSRAIPRSTHQLTGLRLGQTINCEVVPLKYPDWIPIFINMHDFGVLAGSVKTIVFNIGVNFKYEAIMVVKLSLDFVLSSLFVDIKQLGTLVN